MRELDKVLDRNEKVLWEGKPEFRPFILGSITITTPFGVLWTLFSLFFITGVPAAAGAIFLIFGSVFFLIGLLLIFGIPIYQFMAYNRMHYAITDKRVIIQMGVVGRDFKIIDFDQITNAEVNVGFFDKLAGKNTGSIFVSSAGSFARTSHAAVLIPYRLSNIHKPYDIFKFFKKALHDVKTDISFPNRYRPGVNPGYHTKYGHKKHR